MDAGCIQNIAFGVHYRGVRVDFDDLCVFYQNPYRPPVRAIVFCPRNLTLSGTWLLGSNGTENSRKAFSFSGHMVYFLTPAVVPAPLATPSAPLGDSSSSAPVTARPTHGGDALEDHGGSPLSPPADHSALG
jgi:hypothetical protein